MDLDTFWTRYFFKVYQVEKDEERRKALLAGSSQFEFCELIPYVLVLIYTCLLLLLALVSEATSKRSNNASRVLRVIYYAS